MNIMSNNDKNFLYDLPANNDEGAQTKTDAQYSILAAKTMNATRLFQNMLETAIDSVAGSKASAAGTSSAVSGQGARDTAPGNLDAIFDQASSTYGVDKQLLLAVARTESNFTPTATSGSGAMGVMQLMPQTAAEMGVKNAYDATENIMGGAKLLSILLTRYQGDKAKALAAYNAGGNKVDSYGGVPPEIQGYVDKVMSYYSNGVGISDQQLAVAMQSGSDQQGSNAAFASGSVSKVESGADVAGRLKMAFSKFPEHQSYEAFLEELALEMKNDAQPTDAEGAYQMLLANAKTAISRVREKVAASDANLRTLGMDDDALSSAGTKSSATGKYGDLLQGISREDVIIEDDDEDDDDIDEDDDDIDGLEDDDDDEDA